MKNLSIILSALALIGVIVLFGMNMSGNKNAGTSSIAQTKEPLTETKGRIAYVDIDTLKTRYEYYATEKKSFEERQAAMTKELENSGKQFEQDYINAERKAQAGSMTQAEYETTAKRLQQMKQSLEAREQALTAKLLKEQDVFNQDLQQRLDEFLAEYNKDKHFDYILSYSKSLGFIMLTNEQLNITEDVINGMNERYNKDGGKDSKDKTENKKNK